MEEKNRKKTKIKNRYFRNAKLSEYYFLKILKGFSEDVTAKDLAQRSKISEKTIRSVYRRLRNKLLAAIIYKSERFGGTGFYLLRKGKLDEQGKRFLQGIAESDIFTRHIQRHAPRLNSQEDLQGLMVEVVVRVFCNIHLDEEALIDYPGDTKKALLELSEMGKWIKESMQREGFLDKYKHIIERFQEVSAKMKLLLEKEELLALKSKSKPHRYPWDVLYNDLRRYLLKHPL